MRMRTRLFLVLLSAVTLALWTGPSFSARPGGSVLKPGKETLKAPDPVVRRIQQALIQLKHYYGPANGRFSPELEKAIRAYQKKTGQRVDGRATKALANRLETASKVQALLQRLKKVRGQTIDAARQALMSRPDTRRLLEGDKREAAADPARDAAPCFRNPTARCLLTEATQSARAVFKPEMRDWALGEVLVAQARAGLSQEAMDTARRIQDPRLVMAALRDIAKSQARAGRGAEALAASEIIPDPLRRLEALEAIASIQAQKSETGDLPKILGRYMQALEKVSDKGKKVAFLARLAVIISRSGDGAAAALRLAEAERLARALSPASRRGPALRHVASGLAETGNPKRALALLKEVEDKTDHTPVLVTAAAAQARAGNAEEALATAAAIDAKRYRAVVLSRIAIAQAVAGEFAAARETVDKAYGAAEEIKMPFASDYAHNQVALALLEIGRKEKGDARLDYEEAIAKAKGVKDDKLRATLLWTIAAEQRRGGFADAASWTEKQAKAATEKIKSALSRVWMFGDMAVRRLKARKKEAAWAAFNRALSLTENIKNNWSRARALAKTATTLIELTEKL
ncbi:MAG TPA: peptidoglycan-binding protein [Rhodospirillales bacterium]|nr:peptidoglycan-binding protein [Rhodospirillales bacterium]